MRPMMPRCRMNFGCGENNSTQYPVIASMKIGQCINLLSLFIVWLIYIEQR